MAGINEILVLLLIITGIIILPRVFRPRHAARKKSSFGGKIKHLSVFIRIIVCLSLIYPFASALYLKPWNSGLSFYLLAGVLPVIVLWSVIWIISGAKNSQP